MLFIIARTKLQNGRNDIMSIRDVRVFKHNLICGALWSQLAVPKAVWVFDGILIGKCPAGSEPRIVIMQQMSKYPMIFLISLVCTVLWLYKNSCIVVFECMCGKGQKYWYWNTTEVCEMLSLTQFLINFTSMFVWQFLCIWLFSPSNGFKTLTWTFYISTALRVRLSHFYDNPRSFTLDW